MTIRLSIVLVVISLYACGQQTTAKRHIPDPRAKKLLDSASELIEEQQQYEKAIPLLNQAIQIDSNYAAPYVYKASYHWEHEQWDSCIKIVYSLIRINPNNADRYGQLGLLYYYKGDSILSKKFYNEALSRYDKILDTMWTINNQYKFLLVNKAIYLVFLNRQKEANKIFQNASDRFTDQYAKTFFASFINKSKEEVLELLQQKNSDSAESIGRPN
jgi:tetratricopeptide (TPR) repeat protein